jgi:poly(A) polymerase
VAQELLTAWYHERSERVAPQPLLDGDEIMRLAGLRPGPEIGRIMEALREAQAAGDVSTPGDAVRFVEAYRRPDAAPGGG